MSEPNEVGWWRCRPNLTALLLVLVVCAWGPASYGAVELWTAPNAHFSDAAEGPVPEYENPLSGNEYVRGFRVIEWRDADYIGPGNYDDWVYAGPGSAGGDPIQVWILNPGEALSTSTTVPSEIVGVHLICDGDDGLADVYVDGILVAQLDMGIPVPCQRGLVIVEGLANTTHTVEVRAVGAGSGGGTAVAVLGASALEAKWYQPPDPMSVPDVYYGWNEYSVWEQQSEGPSVVVADDWLCENPDPITDAHWWGSYIGLAGADLTGVQRPERFHITIWTDVPDPDPGDPTTFSHPGTVIHEVIRPMADITETFVGWDYMPQTGEYEAMFKYDLILDPSEYFYQEAGGNIYWISIAAEYCACNADIDGNGVLDLADQAALQACFGTPTPPGCESADIDCDGDVDPADEASWFCRFNGGSSEECCTASQPQFYWGWKTRPRDPASLAPDDAVRIFDPWGPILGSTWVNGEPIEWPAGESWDMAFELTARPLGQPLFKWEQFPDLTTTGMDVRASEPFLLANDFPCDVTGPLTDIWVYGSWLGDILPGDPHNVTFILSLHADIPSGPGGYSIPGDLLWLGLYEPGMFDAQIFAGGLNEGWMDPPDGYIFPGDFTCWLYHFPVPIGAFTQAGTLTEPVVYWLDVQAYSGDPGAAFGWKTTELPLVWNDDSVWNMGQDPPVDPWQELFYPPGHPFHPQSLDLAFAIDGLELGEVYVKWSQPPVPYTPEDGYNGWNELSVYEGSQIAADDWVCDSPNPVTDVHWWGSFIGWNHVDPPTAELPEQFHIAIWTDVPAGVDQPFSHPGQVLWEYWCADYTWEFVGWDWDPRNPQAGPEACYYFECVIPQSEWFLQEDGCNIYWTSISAVYPPFIINWPFGWKTRPRSADSLAPDDAVRIFEPTMPDPGMMYGFGEPLEYPPGTSWDLAFIMTTGPTAQPEACCLPDGTCVDLLPDDCVNQGGTPQGLGTVCSGLTEACCLADGTCVDVDPLCCDDLGGTPQGPGSACTALEACCFADDSCQMLDPLCCDDLGGTAQGTGSTCGGNEACCDATTGACYMADRTCCLANGDSPQGAGTTCTAVEACCFADNTCQDLDPLCCADLGGTPQGAGSSCGGTEACCFADGTCTDLDPLCCTDQGGTPQGPGTGCSIILAACCLPDGTCQDLDPLCCDELGGFVSPISNVCLGDANGNGTDDACELPTQACCLPDGSCADMPYGQCVASGGDPQGPGTDCTMVVCHPIKYAQPPTFNPESPTPDCFWGWDEFSVFGDAQIVADDFPCESDDPISDIHWWGSYDGWLGEEPPTVVPSRFHVGIWTDVPAGVDLPFSHPGVMLREWTVAYDALYETPFGCDFHPEFMSSPDTCFKYHFQIPREDWFFQESGACNIYWISIAAQYDLCACDADVDGNGTVELSDQFAIQACFGSPTPPGCERADVDCDGDVDADDEAAWLCRFGGGTAEDCCGVTQPEFEWGWKTRDHVFMDDAVRILIPTAPAPGVSFLEGIPIETLDGLSWDMAFVLTTVSEMEPKWSQPPANPEQEFDAASDLWWPTGLKWEQLPSPHLSGLHAHDYDLGFGYEQIILAEDWYCNGGVVTDFHWWGTIEDPGAGQFGFLLSIHLNDPGNCLPLDPPIWSAVVPISDIAVTPTGVFNNVGYEILRYDYVLPEDQWFFQEQGQQYWFNISSLSNDPVVPFLWLWQERSRGTGILCPAADYLMPSRPFWQAIQWGPQEFSSMAFRVTSRPEVEVNKVMADDFISDGRVIEGVRWWGSYFDDRYIASAGPLYATTPPSDPILPATFGTMDPNTGLFNPIGPLTVPMTEIEWTPDGGILYGTEPGGQIHVLDPNTGASILMTPHVPAGALNGLEYNASGVLLGTLIPAPGSPSDLVVVDPITGVLTPIGPTGFGPIGGLAYDSGFGTLYGIESGGVILPQLLSVNEATGAATPLYPTTIPLKVGSLEFTADGRLVAGAGDGFLWEIDPSSGASFPIGPMVNAMQLSGLSLRPAQVEEPFVLDGWLITFHWADVNAAPACPPDIALDPPPTALGTYFAPRDAVRTVATGATDCLGHAVYEYVVELDQCCLLCSEPDPRNAGLFDLPAQPGFFKEIGGYRYWLSIQAVTGAQWLPPVCDLDLTGHVPSDLTPDRHFWGWHTSTDVPTIPGWLLDDACTGAIADFTPYPPDCWEYGLWDAPLYECPLVPDPPEVNMAFELLTYEVGAPCVVDADCDDQNVCTIDRCVNGTCTFAPRRYGDVIPDNVLNLFDIFCILNLIGGTNTDPACTMEGADLAGGGPGQCGPNGVLNLFDVFAVLDAIGGIDPCCSPQVLGACCTSGVCTDASEADCFYGGGDWQGEGTNCATTTCPAPPAPAASPERELAGRRTETDPKVALQLAPSTRSIKPGEVLTVDVLITGVTDFRGYEVALDVTGGRKGSLGVESITVDRSRQNYVFGRHEAVDVGDVAGSRVVAAKIAGGVDAPEAYLATFAFRASEDASGTFRIVVREGGDTVLLNSVGSKLNVRSITNASVRVR